MTGIYVPENHEITLTACGVDSGIANTGLSVISRLTDGSLCCRGVRLIQTHKDSRSGVRAGQDDVRRMHELWEGIRTTVETVPPDVLGVESYETFAPKGVDRLARAGNRLLQFGPAGSRDGFIEKLSDDRFAKDWIGAYGAMHQALQNPQEWMGVGLGPAAKTIGVLWIAVAVGFERQIGSFVYTPSQMVWRMTKKRFSGKTRRQDRKKAVEDAVIKSVRELDAYATALVTPGKRDHVMDATGHAILAIQDMETYLYKLKLAAEAEQQKANP